VDQTWKHEPIGSAAFLASSMKMPLTAIVLIFEFTRVGHELSDPDFARCYRISLGVSSLCGMQNTTHLESTP
jgi:hypothetical protein